MEVTWQNYAPVNEIGGNYVQFALFQHIEDDKFKALHEHFVCKDFLADLFWYEATQQEEVINIYGFKLNGQIKGIGNRSKKWVGIRVQETYDRNIHKDITAKQENLEKFLRAVYAHMFYQPCNTVIDDDGCTILIKLHPQWFWYPVTISLLTFLIRIGLNYDGTTPVMDFIKNYPVADNDYSYRMSAHQIIEAISQGINCTQTFEEYEHVNRMHNNGGIVSVAGNMEKYFPKPKEEEVKINKFIPGLEKETFKVQWEQVAAEPFQWVVQPIENPAQ